MSSFLCRGRPCLFNCYFMDFNPIIFLAKSLHLSFEENPRKLSANISQSIRKSKLCGFNIFCAFFWRLFSMYLTRNWQSVAFCLLLCGRKVTFCGRKEVFLCLARSLFYNQCSEQKSLLSVSVYIRYLLKRVINNVNNKK